MRELLWISERAVVDIHEAIIAEHGGMSGLRDPNLLSSSLARPQNLFFYNPEASLFDLAAAYGFAKNRPFLDGNKRTALVVIDVFLRINGYRLIAPEPTTAEIILQLAAGAIDQNPLATWIADKSQQL